MAGEYPKTKAKVGFCSWYLCNRKIVSDNGF